MPVGHAGLRRQRAPRAAACNARPAHRRLPGDGLGSLARAGAVVEPAGDAQRARRCGCRAVPRQCVGDAVGCRLSRARTADPRVAWKTGRRAAESDGNATRARRRGCRNRTLAPSARIAFLDARRPRARCVRALLGAGAHMVARGGGRVVRSEAAGVRAARRRMAGRQRSAVRRRDGRRLPNPSRVRRAIARRSPTRGCAVRSSKSARRSDLQTIASTRRSRWRCARSPIASTPIRARAWTA